MEKLGKETLKEFIADNRLTDAIENLRFQLAEYLQNNKGHRDYDLMRRRLNDLIMQSGNLKSLHNERLAGIVDRKTEKQTTAEVRFALLELIDELPEQFWGFSHCPSSKTKKNERRKSNKQSSTPKPPKNKKALWIGILAAIAIAVALYLYVNETHKPAVSIVGKETKPIVRKPIVRKPITDRRENLDITKEIKPIKPARRMHDIDKFRKLNKKKTDTIKRF